MNVYDFDNTIYKGDSTFDFYRFCALRHPKILLRLPKLLWDFVKFRMGKQTKTQFKEQMYKFLLDVPDAESEVNIFWDKNIYKIKKFYRNIAKTDDVIISASPEFLVTPACRRIGLTHIMASRVDIKTGKYSGLNCHGEEKVKRFYERFPEGVIDNFYSDSLSDTPLAKLATKESYLVKGETLEQWKR